MPGTLTPEQSTERDAYRIDNPNRVDDDIVTEATVNGPPDEDGWQTWTITGEQGWTFGQFRLPPDMDAPAPGDTFTTYGGFGFPVIGGDLRGEPCWFKTAAEVQAERDAWLAEQGEKKRRAYEENKGEIQATYEALDPDLKVRIDRFVANCPEDWWVEFGGYEMFALDVATKIATAARQSDDPQEAVRYYSELPYGEQTALVPDAEIGQMSGNQFGYSVSVAYWLVAEPSKDRALFLRWGHGAMVPLTGCESYGCKPPTEEELHALWQIVASGETSDEIDITGLDPAAVLAALYNASKPIGMGVLQARDGDMTVAEAQVLLAQTNNFDYLYGRPIKVTIPTDTSEPGTIINPRNYDCNFGIGTAAAAIDAIREG